jgi:hypothetical protein
VTICEPTSHVLIIYRPPAFVYTSTMTSAALPSRYNLGTTSLSMAIGKVAPPLSKSTHGYTSPGSVHHPTPP